MSQKNQKRLEWKPIETAPKDGTQILIWMRDPWNRCEKVLWYEKRKHWTTYDAMESDNNSYFIGSLVPTHWMPLPEPPENAE